MINKFVGKSYKFGNNINTDIISPPAYMELETKEAAKYTMYTVDANFYNNFKEDNILVAENNFGSGSSRETAPLCLKEVGVKIIIAKSFARIFYRNAINLGIIVVECEQTDRISQDDVIEVDCLNGKIINKTKNETYNSMVLPNHILDIILKGGLVSFIKEKLNKIN